MPQQRLSTVAGLLICFLSWGRPSSAPAASDPSPALKERGCPQPRQSVDISNPKPAKNPKGSYDLLLASMNPQLNSMSPPAAS